MIRIGIDNSISSPGLCIYNKGKYHFYFLTQRKREIGIENDTDKYYIKGYEYPEWETREERIDRITNILMDRIIHHINGEEYKIIIEGYAFSAQSRSVTTLAECGGVLRHKLHRRGYEYEEVPPTVIKKFFTGKGNCTKEHMFLQYKNYIKDWGLPDFHVELNFPENKNSKVPSPIDDLIDSHAIVCYNMGTKIKETDIVSNILRGLK
jgi:Holliday junction resolvasome RuvABC endonuclease subunit